MSAICNAVGIHLGLLTLLHLFCYFFSFINYLNFIIKILQIKENHTVTLSTSKGF